MVTRQRLPRAKRFTVAVVALCVFLAPVFAQSGPDALAGLRLDDALRVLQARGLRIVFSSELVTPDLRVHSEPRAKGAREQLAEILDPHGLTGEIGPGGVIQVVRQKRRARERSRGAVAPPRSSHDNETSPVGAIYRERVTVTAKASESGGSNAGSERRLGPGALRDLAGHAADDPFRIVQALPGVAGGDDFRSEYSIRGSSYRHAAVVIDGVVAPWLQHAALGRGDTGTLAMFRSDTLEEAALLVGAYPRRDSSQLGPQLNLTLREGSRTARRFRVGVSVASTTLTGEGPLGSAARGSWLVAARKSHVEWPIGRSDHDGSVFGFGDLQSKLVYDLRPDQHVSLSLVAGLSNIERDDPNPIALSDGINRAAMVSLAWRSVFGSRMVITQRVSSLTQAFLNRDQAARPAGRGGKGAGAYRLDVTRTLFTGVVEAGGQMRRVHGSWQTATRRTLGLGLIEPVAIDNSDASWIERSAYASYRRALGAGVTLDGGLRLADSTLSHRDVVDRWLRAEWSAGPRWLLHGSTGVIHQFPTLEQVSGVTGTAHLRPERAAHADLGIGQRVTSSVRWDATIFARREADALREPDLRPRLVDGVLVNNEVPDRFENSLSGSAHGIELTIERQNHTGVSGWVSYSYGVARYSDAARLETFHADFDQRHAINASGIAALPSGTRVGLTFRAGTNFPIPGYFVNRDGHLYAGNERNRARLPAYARLDLRAERTFVPAGHRITLFAEALNVLNRVNVGLANGAMDPGTGEALGFTERLFPRLVTGGVRLEF